MQKLKPVTKPTKQRKMLYQAPAHIRHKLFSAILSPKLRTSYGVKNLPVRSGDTVRVMRGDHKGLEGKITRVDSRKYRLYIEGLTREKVDGTAISVPVHPSKVMIINLNLDDKWRKKVLERKRGIPKKAERVVRKPERRLAEAEAAEEAKAEEEPKGKKPRKRKRKIAKKPVAEKAEGEAPETGEETLKAKTTRKRRKTTRKTEGGA
jgi:large subunit ribosomal protein L24